MLKKGLFTAAIVLLSVGAYAREYVTPEGSNVDWEYDGASAERKAESYNWPAAYQSQDICTIPVRMDVGFWIKVNGAKDLKLNLKQVEIHKYSGSVDVSINCNVNIKLGVSWSKASNIDLGGYSSSVSVSPSTLDAPGGTVTVNLTLSNVNLQNLQGGQNCLQVGVVTLKVTPNVTPQLAGGCSS
jgi:hypothetical protein